MSQMKFVFEKTIRGVTKVYTATVANGADPGLVAKIVCGVGNAFYAFDSLPGTVLAADFDGAPVVDNDVTVNNTAIDAMIANPPLDKVTI